jgi:hypothetical protein
VFQPIETKKIPKKVFLEPQRAKNSYEDYLTEFAGSTQNPKNNYRNVKTTNQNESSPKKKYV